MDGRVGFANPILEIGAVCGEVFGGWIRVKDDAPGSADVGFTIRGPFLSDGLEVLGVDEEERARGVLRGGGWRREGLGSFVIARWRSGAASGEDEGECGQRVASGIMERRHVAVIVRRAKNGVEFLFFNEQGRGDSNQTSKGKRRCFKAVYGESRAFDR